MSANFQSPAYFAECSSNWFNPYATENQQYNPYTAQAYNYQYYNNAAQTNCCVALDDYTDDDDSDSDSEKPPTKQTPAKAIVTSAKPIVEPTKTIVEDTRPADGWKQPLKEADEEDTATADEKSPRNSQGSEDGSPTSTLEPSDSDSCDLESEDLLESKSIASSDSEKDVDIDTVETFPCFSIHMLLMFSHTVSLADGVEDYPLKAEKEKKQPEARTEKPRKDTTEGGWRSEMKAPASPKSKASVPAEELQASEGSWQAQQVARRQAAKELESKTDEEIVRAMKSLLNKLTVEKFTQISEKIVSCGMRNTAHVEVLVNEVFQKATMQHHFIDMYADLCDLLHAHFVEHPISDDETMSFKSILLRGSQSFFETHMKQPTDLMELDEEDRIEKQRKYKLQVIGNVKFMGALLVRQMLASKVFFAICEELIADPTPESLESLATLLTVVGPKFDNPGWSAHALLLEVFQKVQDIMKDPKLSCRVKFLLKDLLELRAAAWQERKANKIAGPSTLMEVAMTQAADDAASCAKGSPTWGRSTKSAGADKDAPQPVHVKVEKCKFGRRCTRMECWHQHPHGRLIDDTTEASEKQEMINTLSSSKCPWADKSKVEQTPKQSRGKAFDKDAWRRELNVSLRELRMSHDVQEALTRVWTVFVPVSLQADEVCDMLSHMVEEGSAATRMVYFEFVAGLVGKGQWKVSSLQKGLQSFLEDICPDLKYDVPALPNILWDELHPTLAPVVAAQ